MIDAGRLMRIARWTLVTGLVLLFLVMAAGVASGGLGGLFRWAAVVLFVAACFATAGATGALALDSRQREFWNFAFVLLAVAVAYVVGWLIFNMP